MLLSNAIKFQKTLALAASASNTFEAAAAELAARRLMEVYDIDPTIIPDPSLYNRMSFADNALLKKLRNEWREQHPAPEVKPPPQGTSEPAISPIAFNIENFRKFNRKKAARKPAVQLTSQDHETIRLLLNKGFGLKDVAAQLGHIRETINSTRAYHLRSGKWVRIDGQLHWADQPVRPAWADPPGPQFDVD